MVPPQQGNSMIDRRQTDSGATAGVDDPPDASAFAASGLSILTATEVRTSAAALRSASSSSGAELSADGFSWPVPASPSIRRLLCSSSS